MKLVTKITTAGITALALGGAVAGTAVAAGNAGAKPAAVSVAQSEPTGPDTDAIQQGDQTSPDNAAAAAEQTGPDTDAIQQGDQTSPDNGTAAATTASHSVSGENPESAGEQQSPSDGPGGHADPAGDVQHEFSGVE